MAKNLVEHNYHSIDATIIADSKNEFGQRIISFVLTFPRIVLAEFNTHRMLCLAGDSKLTFDLPSGQKNSDYRPHYMTIEEFYNKWSKGATKRKRHSFKVNLDNKNYSAKEIAGITGKSVSNIRTRCRKGDITVINPDKKRNEDFIINGLDYNKYHNSYETNGQKLNDRLSKMRIRQLNEDTGLIQNSTIKKCVYSGTKDVYKLSLINGDSIKASKEHRILTEKGWKRVKDIEESDYVITQKFGTIEESDPYKYKKIDGKWVNQFIRENKQTIIERQKGICKNCPSDIEDMHHIVPVHKDTLKAFDLDNIVGLCKSCHNKEHEKQDWQVSQYLYGSGIKVNSINYIGKEKTYDLEIGGDFPNFLANNIIVHNSRNSASSRAIPFKKMVKDVLEHPFVPIAWQKDHKGMQGTEYIDVLNGDIFPPGDWLEARDHAVDIAEEMNADGVTKQLCNRLLEPFKWHTVICTATNYENFFALRAHEAAEIHIQKLAYVMLEEYNNSEPKQFKAGEWHIPFGDNMDIARVNMVTKEFEDGSKTSTIIASGYDIPKEAVKEWSQLRKIKIATARCARVSYENFEGGNDYQKDIELHDRLASMGHWSPFEHCARAMSKSQYYDMNFRVYQPSKNTVPTTSYGWSGNFQGFVQYRKMFNNENKKDKRIK